jgi:hypothetical protein
MIRDLLLCWLAFNLAAPFLCRWLFGPSRLDRGSVSPVSRSLGRDHPFSQRWGIR